MGRRGRRRKFEPTSGQTGPKLDREGRAVLPEQGDRRELRIIGGLEDEDLVYLRLGRRGEHQVALAQSVENPSPRRVEARCAVADQCGGCSLQHLGHEHQIAHKQELLLSDLAEHGVEPERVLDPIVGSAYHYRRRARLGVRWVEKKGRALVGFREKRDTRFVADCERCEVLEGGVGDMLTPLAELIAKLSIRDRVPQIEVAVGEDSTVMVFRVLELPTEEDREALRAFGESQGVRIDLQTKGLDTVAPMDGGDAYLSYTLEPWKLKLRFLPTDFVQVNHEVNQMIIASALEQLQLEQNHRVLDLFCGIGNFTLPLATRVREVVGVEGDEALVQRARDNARANGLDGLRFVAQDLYSAPDRGDWAKASFDRILLDPPRSGAEQVLPQVAAIGAPRVVYVACSPSTLARDAGILVREHGYTLEAAGIADMFPHTAHVESIAVFRRG